jgi:hypothetical protein
MFMGTIMMKSHKPLAGRQRQHQASKQHFLLHP